MDAVSALVDLDGDSIAHGNPAIAMFLKSGFVEDRATDEAVYLRRSL